MDTNSKLSNNTAVILVSHGSTLPYAEEVFVEIKEKDDNITTKRINENEKSKTFYDARPLSDGSEQCVCTECDRTSR